MERTKLMFILLFTMLLVFSLFDWYVNINIGDDGRPIEPEIRLSDEEAKLVIGSAAKSYRKYYWKQKSVVVTKRTLIPFVYTRDTLYKGKVEYYSREK